MKYATPIAFNIIYWIYGILTFIPVYLLISDNIQIPILSFILSLIVSGIPVVNIIIGIVGAIKILELPIVGVILFYLAPIILPFIIFIFSKKDNL